MKALPQLQAQSEETKRNNAMAALRQIDTVLQKIREKEEHRRTTERGWERRVWAGLVRYLNADLSSDAKAYAVFLKLLYELTSAPELTEFSLKEFGKGDDFFHLSELSG